MKLTRDAIDGYVESALREDLGAGDLTTDAVLEGEDPVRAGIIARQGGVVAGLPLVEGTFTRLDPASTFEVRKRDGDRVRPADKVMEIVAGARAVLTGERTALNFLQHLSGIATRVDAYLEAMDTGRAVLLDTRKTTPGLRVLEKYAVRVGGARNHRMGLFDGVLIKENHTTLAGGPAAAVRRVRGRFGTRFPVELEVHSLEEFEEAAGSGADILLLDNLTPEEVREAVGRKPKGILLEASGGIVPGNIREYESTGVDRISAGGLIHSATWLDFSLVVEGWKNDRNHRP